MNTDKHGLEAGQDKRGTGFACGLLLASLLGLAGCSLPQAQSDPTRFYVLASNPAGAPAAKVDAPSVRVRPVEVASYLRGRPLVVRRGANEIAFHEFARWGEALEQGVGRVVREELRGRGIAASESGHGGSAPASQDLTIRVLACEGAADGSVLFHATWELTDAGGGSGKHGDYRASGLTWDRKNEATLAAGLSEAVRGLAAEIASTVK